MKEIFASYGTQFSGRRETARSRGAPLNDVPRKQQRAGEEEEAADADVTDLIAQVHLKLSAQLEARVRDLESPTYSTLFVPKESDIVKEIQNAGRYYSDMVGKPTKRGKRKSAHLVLQRDAESHGKDPKDQDRRIERSRPGEGRRVEDAQDDHRRKEVPRAEHVDKSMQAPPNIRKAWADTQIADRRGGEPPFAPLEDTLATQDGAQHKRCVRIQDLVRHTVILCGAQAPPGRAPRGNPAREVGKAYGKKARESA